MFQKRTFQANHHGPHAAPQKGTEQPKWYIIDGKDQVVGRLATTIARVLRGKHKPTFTRHADTGDFVIVTNVDKVQFTRNKWNQKNYYRHSGYVGGLKTTSALDLLKNKPEEILKTAVKGMMGHSRLADRQLQKLKLYCSTEHPHESQKPQPFPNSVLFNAKELNSAHEQSKKTS